MQARELFQDQRIHLYDTSINKDKTNPLSHFALVDSLMDLVGENHEPALYFWDNNRLVILGGQDTHLPHFHDALTVIDSYGYSSVIRNSGGLGIVSDEGVLNASIIIPNIGLSINDAYDIVYELFKKLIGSSLETGKIANSYCPGDYDISINGLKISGISQRRKSNAIAIMFYISLYGDQLKRGEIMKNFYTIGLKDKQTKLTYPQVDPTTMTNLSDVIKLNYNLDSFKNSFCGLFANTYNSVIEKGTINSYLKNNYKNHYAKLRKRNDRYFCK